jgi:hypothetical protein
MFARRDKVLAVRRYVNGSWKSKTPQTSHAPINALTQRRQNERLYAKLKSHIF